MFSVLIEAKTGRSWLAVLIKNNKQVAKYCRREAVARELIGFYSAVDATETRFEKLRIYMLFATLMENMCFIWNNKHWGTTCFRNRTRFSDVLDLVEYAISYSVDNEFEYLLISIVAP